MPAYIRPAVYYETVDASPPAISALRMDVAGFVGIAERGPVDTPVPVESYRQFRAHFGDFTPAGYLAYAVRAFFENGGQRAWIIRVTAETASAAATVINDVDGSPTWRIAASSPGAWGNNVEIALTPSTPAQSSALEGALRRDGCHVTAIRGFARGSLIRLAQKDGATLREEWRVISHVEPVTSEIFWVHPDPRLRLPTDRPLTALVPGVPTLVEALELTLAVYEAGRLSALYEDLSLVADNLRHGPRLLAAPRYDIAPDQLGRLAPAPSVVIESVAPLGIAIPRPLAITAGQRIRLVGGRDGLAALKPDDFMEIGTGIGVAQVDGRGFRALGRIGQIAAVAIPDIVVQPAPLPQYDRPEPRPTDPCLPCPPTQAVAPFIPSMAGRELPPVFNDEQVFMVQAALVDDCERRGDRVALLDPPFDVISGALPGVAGIEAWRRRFDSSYAALYYPWLTVVEPLKTAITRRIPPSGHVAGQISRTDATQGVHKAPANSPLDWAEGLSRPVSDATHGLLNEIDVNVLRALPGRAMRIMGGRTLSSDLSRRYLNVRRLLILLRRSITVGTQWVAFEPNDATTRRRVTLALIGLLDELWRRGAFAGDSPAAAYGVRCDESNNPPSERENGRLIVDIAVAPAVPFEFVVLRVGRTAEELDVTELGVVRGTQA